MRLIDRKRLATKVRRVFRGVCVLMGHKCMFMSFVMCHSMIISGEIIFRSLALISISNGDTTVLSYKRRGLTFSKVFSHSFIFTSIYI